MRSRVKNVKVLKISEEELGLMRLLQGSGLQKHQLLSQIPNISSERISHLLENLTYKLMVQYIK